MVELSGRGGRTGRRSELIIGAKVRHSRRGSVRWARESTGRWDLTGGEGRGVFQLSGMTFGGKRVQRHL